MKGCNSILVVVAYLFVACTHAGQTPQEANLLSKSPASKVFPQLGVLVDRKKILLGKSTLLDVVTSLTGGSTVRDGSEASDRYSVCYVLTEKASRQVVRFVSDAELGATNTSLQ